MLPRAEWPLRQQDNKNYCWIPDYKSESSIQNKIPVPAGFSRVPAPAGSFGEWLRGLPLKKDNTVHLYTGELKANQQANYAVIDMDAGDKDLQQCADAVMRLRGEYLFSRSYFDSIHFNFTSGDRVDFKKWSAGKRPVIKGNSVEWSGAGEKGTSYKNFKAYMQLIFTYAGTLSLSRELKPTDLSDMRTGDVFIQGGSPGHAVIVADMCENKIGEKLFLLAQSYMPAQEMHVLVNPNDKKRSPWYSVNGMGQVLKTPEWDFEPVKLMRF